MNECSKASFVAHGFALLLAPAFALLLVACGVSRPVPQDATSITRLESDTRLPDPSAPFQCPEGTRSEEIAGTLFCKQDDGDAHGPFFDRRDGWLRRAGFWDDGKQVDGYLEYYENGQIALKARYVDGKPAGEWTWYHEDGSLRRIGQFSPPGMHTGVWEQWSPDGSLLGSFQIQNGTGTIYEWYDNGQLQRKYQVTNGDQVEGVDETWFPDGTRKEMKNYSGGMRHGEHLYWHESAKLAERTVYESGIAEGPFKRWYPDGTLRLEGVYKDGDRHGRWASYNRDGTDSEVEHWEAGEREGQFQSYHSNGQVSYEGLYKNGEKTGTWQRFDAAGRITRKEAWRDGKRHGTWKSFHVDESTPEGQKGALASERQYEDGKPAGVSRWWRADGTLEMEVDYTADGRPQTRKFDESGDLVQRCSGVPGLDLECEDLEENSDESAPNESSKENLEED